MHESQLRRGRSGEPGLGRRAENEARAGVEKVGQASRRGRVVAVGKERKERKERATDDARALYPAKAAGARAHALPNAGGRGFRMRACRLVVYSLLLSPLYIIILRLLLFKYNFRNYLINLLSLYYYRLDLISSLYYF